MSVEQVLSGELKAHVECADLLTWLPSLPERSVDLVFGSPPYMDARTYGIDAVRDCREWVAWMLQCTEAAIRVSKGLVLWVAAGVQRQNCYWPGCEGLMWEWWSQGNHLWRPCVWRKSDENGGGSGIPGSGGKQYLRGDWEYVMAFKREGWLPWADNTAMGHEPVYDRTGGEMSNRTADGRRINADVGNGTRKENGSRPMPKLANPGNFLEFPAGVVQARVGGGHMGNRLCHENEAPFPEKLAEFFIRSFCPPGGVVLDPFSGSGTTVAMAVKWKRRGLGCDIRQSQVDLARRRIGVEQPELFVQ